MILLFLPQSPTSSVYSPRPDAAQQPDSDSFEELRQPTTPAQSRLGPASTPFQASPPRRAFARSGSGAPTPRSRARDVLSHRLGSDGLSELDGVQDGSPQRGSGSERFLQR